MAPIHRKCINQPFWCKPTRQLISCVGMDGFCGYRAIPAHVAHSWEAAWLFSPSRNQTCVPLPGLLPFPPASIRQLSANGLVLHGTRPAE